MSEQPRNTVPRDPFEPVEVHEIPERLAVPVCPDCGVPYVYALGKDRSYVLCLKCKTTVVLAEAEHVLRRFPPFTERN